MDSQNNRLGFGWVLRNDRGTFITCISRVGNYTPKEAEAMSIREALAWLKLHGFERVNVETDALLVVQNLSKAVDTSSFNLLLLDIKNRISQFNCLTIFFAKWSANWVAHLLTQKFIFMSDGGEWFNNPSSFTCNALHYDLSLIWWSFFFLKKKTKNHPFNEEGALEDLCSMLQLNTTHEDIFAYQVPNFFVLEQLSGDVLVISLKYITPPSPSFHVDSGNWQRKKCILAVRDFTSVKTAFIVFRN